ncbi:hypothetical protein CYMTET_35370 [Cymbomonas tetramitiformis]|uniref:Uncharacterized protein n=1 Tax=Cymbomonas tetramitiformis TaxID=36881 RepID=A0AAE0F997_9CHLO|nr:hypothetical protein CYMTET_35370 [Cymbomonas tetramitiformis]
MELLPASLKLGTKKRKRTYGRLSGKKHPWHLDYEVAAEQSNTCLYVPVLIKETNSQPMDQADGNTGTCITDGSKAAASGILRCNNCLRTGWIDHKLSCISKSLSLPEQKLHVPVSLLYSLFF